MTVLNFTLVWTICEKHFPFFGSLAPPCYLRLCDDHTISSIKEVEKVFLALFASTLLYQPTNQNF